MEVTADLGKILHGLDHSFGHMARVWARKSDSINAGDFVHQSEQFGKIAATAVGRFVVIDNLAEQMNLAMSLACCKSHFLENFCRSAHAFVAPRVGDHTKRAEVVASLYDRYRGAYGI
tara:strand:- start:54 stop:407 length:354 start_codon:yes stop_codon:yes gene_type:complete